MDRVVQASVCSCWLGADGFAPECHPSKIWQFYPAGRGVDGCGCDGIQSADRLQPLYRLQALCCGLSGGGDLRQMAISISQLAIPTITASS